jgi:tetratricopeptide (TPR) repeat protein
VSSTASDVRLGLRRRIAGRAVTKIIYESEHLVVFHREGRIDDLLVTFSYLNMKIDAPDIRYFAEPVAEKLDLSALGIVIKQDDWFAPSRMLEMISTVQPILNRYTRRILLGSSMGGYGAIKYSAALKADAVLACVPQVSIQPSEVGLFDERFARFYNSTLHDGSGIVTNDARGVIYLIYDPFHMQDSSNIRVLRERIPDAIPIVAPFLGHDVYGSMVGSGQFQQIMEAAFKRESSRIQCLVAIKRRTLPRRKTGILQLAVKRHPAWGASVLREHEKNLSPAIRDDLRARFEAGLADLAFKKGNLGEAIAHLRTATAMSPLVAYRWGRLSWFLQESKDLNGAIVAARRAYDLDPTSSYSLERLGRVLSAQAEWDEALIYALRAVALYPHHAMSLQLLSLVLNARGDFDGALGFLDQAIAQNPAGASWWANYRARLQGQIENEHAKKDKLVH